MTNRLLAHLAHVELLTPRIKETLWFFRDLLSMRVTHTDGGSVYLRAWGEFSIPFSLRLTRSRAAGLGHVAFRADSQEDLETVVRMSQKDGSAIGWVRDEFGHPNAFRFRSPDGHQNEVFWEMSKYRSRKEDRSRIKARPMKMPGSILSVSRLDHCTLFASDVKPVREFYQRLGFKYNEGVVSSARKRETGAFMTISGRSHDIGILGDMSGARGRLNHVAFYVENVGLWVEGCDVLVENGILVEMGPIRHGITDSLGVYAIEPGGNRIEFFHGGYLNPTPVSDWEPIVTDIDKPEGRYGTAWGLGLNVESWLTYGTPPVDETEDVKREMEKLIRLRRQHPHYPGH